MSNKNPFEIRLELLKMAQEMAYRAYSESVNSYWSIMNDSVEAANKSTKEMLEQYKEYLPDMYTPREVMEKAEELYKFVTKKD